MILKPTKAQKRNALALFTCPVYYDDLLRRNPQLENKTNLKTVIELKRANIQARCQQEAVNFQRRRWADLGEKEAANGITPNFSLQWICSLRMTATAT